MPVNDDLGIRMKTYYEQIPKIKLMRRTPVMIRIDGKAFHTFTKGFQKPFDEVLIKSMQETTKYLCENIQGCVLGYTQSDEITLVLVDYHNLETAAWFDYEVQKMCSIAASMATMSFNRLFARYVDAFSDFLKSSGANADEEEKNRLLLTYQKAVEKGAMFDARVFNIPKEEVTNCIYWRQLDAARNSVQMVGQANFTHKELQNKSCNKIQDMLIEQKGINWNNFPTCQKRGTCVVKERYLPVGTETKCSEGDNKEPEYRTRWKIDTEIPIFKGEDRDYVERLVVFEGQ